MNPFRLVLVCLICLLVGVVPSAAQTLRIFHIDVDQGDAKLFVSPSGNTLLVDSGKNGHGDRIRAVLAQAGATRIDHFVATHYHEDHYGGVDELTERSLVRTVTILVSCSQLASKFGRQLPTLFVQLRFRIAKRT